MPHRRREVVTRAAAGYDLSGLDFDGRRGLPAADAGIIRLGGSLLRNHIEESKDEMKSPACGLAADRPAG
jgi:hypothetical protein